MPNIEHIRLYDWGEISDSYKNTLVLGNGASIAISPSFNYKSLFSSAKEAHLITDELNQIFEHFETENFEYILNLVSTAHVINFELGIQELETERVYGIVRSALIKIVQETHVTHEQVVPFFPPLLIS